LDEKSGFGYANRQSSPELRAHQFDVRLNIESFKVEPVGVPASSDGWVVAGCSIGVPTDSVLK